jgi:penicillin-insensitive murein endopeptidase
MLSQNRMRKLVVSLLLSTLVACSQSGTEFVAKSVETTDPTLSPSNPMTIKPVKPGSTPIDMGYLAAVEPKVMKDPATGIITLETDVVLKDADSQILHQRRVTLKGQVTIEGKAVLKPESKDVSGEPPVRARVTCMSALNPADCDEAIIDIFMKVDGKIHATQIVADLRQNTPPESFAPTHVSEPTDVVETDDAEEYEPETLSPVAPAAPATETPAVQTPAETKPKVDKKSPAPTQPRAPDRREKDDVYVAPKKTAPAAPAVPKKQEETPKKSEPAPTTAPKKPEAAPKKSEPAPAPKTPAAPAKKAEAAPTPKKTAPAPKKAVPKKEKAAPSFPSAQDEEGGGTSDEEGTDPTDRPSIYVGTLYEGADDLFEDDNEPAPKPADDKPDASNLPQEAPRPPVRPEPVKPQKPATPQQPAPPQPSPPMNPKNRPKDQAIGSPNKGTMQNATSMKDRLAAAGGTFRLLNEWRKRYYGTFELAEVIQYIASYSKKLPVSGALRVGDLSQKDGGKLVNSRHKSHQNGLDADLGYPTANLNKDGGFADLVKGGKINSDLSIPETWALFKTAWASKTVDRIFLDQLIKNSLCELAKKKGEFGSHTELLRRLRPTAGHDTHFHLRIRCSVHQPRCRMMGDPPAGSGC